MSKLKNCNRIIFLVIGLICLANLPVFGQNVEINKRPLREFAEMVSQKVETKEVDLTTEFSVELKGILKKDGHFDTKQTKFTKSEGDKKIIEVAKSAIKAISDSGWLGYLSNFGVEKIVISLSQDKANVRVILFCEMPTSEKAKMASSGFNAILKIAILMSNQDSIKLGEDEKLLLNSTKAMSESSNFVININVPKEKAQEMINRNLKEVQLKQQLNSEPINKNAILKVVK